MLMICNLPNNQRVESVMEAFDDMGFADGYDYVYLPLDRHSSCNKGYGFVHFMLSETAHRFMQLFEGYSSRGELRRYDSLDSFSIIAL